jgi:hypothetical protein
MDCVMSDCASCCEGSDEIATRSAHIGCSTSPASPVIPMASTDEAEDAQLRDADRVMEMLAPRPVDHAGSDVVDPMEAVRGLDRARWMTQFGDAIADCTLSQIAMVGAHDAATHSITRKNPGEYAADAPDALVNITRPLQWAAHRLAADWARTQEHSVRTMLLLGVRYFDLRLSPRGPTKELWISHGLFSMPLSNVVEDVASFYSNHDSGPCSPATADSLDVGDNLDIVVLDIQRLSGVTSGHGSAKIHHEFFRTLEPLRPLLLKEGQSIFTSLRDFWRTGTRVIVLYPCALACAVHQPIVLPRTPEFIRSHWFDKNRPAPLLQHLHDELMQRRNGIVSRFVHSGPPEGSAIGPLHVLQAVLTPSSTDFARMVFSPFPSTARNLEHFAKELNHRALTLWSRHQPIEDGPEVTFDGKPRPRQVSMDGRNVIMLDFFTRGRDGDTGLDAVQLCVFINARRFGLPRERSFVSRSPTPAPLDRIVGSSDAASPRPQPEPQDVVESMTPPVTPVHCTSPVPSAGRRDDGGEASQPAPRPRTTVDLHTYPMR